MIAKPKRYQIPSSFPAPTALRITLTPSRNALSASIATSR